VLPTYIPRTHAAHTASERDATQLHRGQQAAAHGLLATLLAGCVCSVLTLPAAQAEGLLPLHWAARNGTRLEVIQALLEAHPEAAKVADKV